MKRPQHSGTSGEFAPFVRELQILNDADVVKARREARNMAATMSFTRSDCLEFSRAVGELAYNAWSHAGGGAVVLSKAIEGERVGIRVDVRDYGPGIPNLEAVVGTKRTGMQATGLAGVELVVGPLEVETTEHGTRISATKWERPDIRELNDRLAELI